MPEEGRIFLSLNEASFQEKKKHAHIHTHSYSHTISLTHMLPFPAMAPSSFTQSTPFSSSSSRRKSQALGGAKWNHLSSLCVKSVKPCSSSAKQTLLLSYSSAHPPTPGFLLIGHFLDSTRKYVGGRLKRN
jgi:hypothetical protein